MNETRNKIMIIEMAKIASEIEALLEGAAKLHEANDFDHSIALVYLALDKVREIA